MPHVRAGTLEGTTRTTRTMMDGSPRTSTAEHWDLVYATKEITEVGWFQADPAVSMRLLSELVPSTSSVIDVGAGASGLVDVLLDAGFLDVTVLDVSDEALAVVRDRLAERASAVSFVEADVRSWAPPRQWHVWHDRAVFHFLVDPHDQARYVTTAGRAIASGGVAVIGCFAPDGPEQCSGLPTARYDAEALAERFGDAFRLERSLREVHTTPEGTEQAFTWAVLRRR